MTNEAKERKSRAQKERRERLKAAGRCVGCEGISDRPGKCYCSECAKKRRELNRKQYVYRVARGRCPRCGRVNENGKITCGECLEMYKVFQARKKTQGV